MAPICTDVRRKFAKTIELQALDLTLVSCPRDTFPLPNTVPARNPLPDERPAPIPPELWRPALSGRELSLSSSSVLRARPIHPPLRLHHSQSGERTNHMFRGRISSGQHPRPKYLELSCLSPRHHLALPCH